MSSKTKRKSRPCATYFDNNGTTLISKVAERVYIEWIRCYNPSTDSKIAKPSKQILQKATDSILSHCGVSTATHTVIFTSGGTESNCFIIRSCVKAYKKKLSERGSELRPHIILSATEHPSSVNCVKDLIEAGDVDVTYIQPTIYGNILPGDVDKEIKPNTCLITIMYANNEIPIINNIREIGEIAHKNRIPMHSDCVQIFGKYKINIKNDNIDALSASAHKFYGPKGVGLLIISNVLIDGYGLTGEINGSQQGGLRGGTENIPAIASMMTALKNVFVKRKEKNAKLYKLRTRLLEKLSKYYKFNEFTNYVYNDNISNDSKKDNSDYDEHNDKENDTSSEKNDIELVSLGPPEDKKGFILPNTILLAICKNKGRPFCNLDLKHFLDKKNFIISIGSACSTTTKNASYVLTAIGSPPIIKRGVIRISFGDDNTINEVDRFAVALKQGIESQCRDLEYD
jgi:cysteine sulfinate desulfinase/cysteine desulfurase-like protein